MRERDALDDRLNALGRIKRELDDQLTMIELGESEKDDKTVADAEGALKKLRADVARRELEALLSGEADANDAFLEVHAGAGGTESQDWAGMLMRMYIRWAEAHGYKVEWVEETEGEGAGLKSATVTDQGPQRLWLAQEREWRASAGAHLAVRLQCAPPHLVCQRCRLSGNRRPHQDRHQRERRAHRCDALERRRRPARQQNRVGGALTHIPTNIVVKVQQDRSQHRNRAIAWDMLRARLFEAEMRKREEKAIADQAAKTDIGWGHQIRSYVLQPYQMVKDLRTGVHTSDTAGVLDGDLDQFMQAALAQKAFGGGPDRSKTSNSLVTGITAEFAERPNFQIIQALQCGDHIPVRVMGSTVRSHRRSYF